VVLYLIDHFLKRAGYFAMMHIMTFDIEAWFHGHFKSCDCRSYRGYVEDLIVKETGILLDLLDETNNKATFFILGEIAEDHPNLVKRIHHRGFEIASHFMHHDLVYQKSPKQFRDELRQGVDILEQLIGAQVQGFRAPSWSVSKEKTPWFWDILIEQGLSYSSSRFRAQTYLYGDPQCPLFAHQIKASSGRVWEFPPSCCSILGRTVPFSGGFYFRILPLAFIRMATLWYEKRGKPVVFYLHPKEIDGTTPDLPLSLIERPIDKWGVKRCLTKARKLLSHTNTVSFSELLQENLDDVYKG
jgi:polysaccharide deacetylase family protein (PEP-CTERM system associated)